MALNPIIVPGFTATYKPVTRIVPFTYRDGMTYLEVLEELRNYVTNVLVAFVELEFADLGDEFENAVNAQIDATNAALAAQTTTVNGAIATLTASVNASIATIINNSVTVQGAVIEAVLTNPVSTSRVALDAAYANKATQTAVDSGRLSVASMALKADASTVTAGLALKADAAATTTALGLKADTTALTTGLATKASLATQTTVETGRLSAASISNQFADNNKIALAAKVGGSVYVGDQFNYLNAGLKAPTVQNTRVIILGDSHASESSVGPNLSIGARLSRRAGAQGLASGVNILKLVDVGGAVSATGMRWYDGAYAGGTSSTYVDSPKLVKINYVQPRYVFHIIGANDYNAQVPIATYKANLRAAFLAIESANASCVNVAVHTHGRPAPASPTITWDMYGIAMREVVEELPSQRVYINSDDVFNRMGMDGTNRSGLMFPDNTHLNASGTRLFADIICAYTGIPTETDFGNLTQHIAFPAIPATAQNDYIVVSSVAFVAASYARSVEVNGKFYGTFGNALDELHVQLFVNGTFTDRRRFRAVAAGIKDVTISGMFTALAGDSIEIKLLVAPNSTANTITPIADVQYTYLNAVVNAL